MKCEITNIKGACTSFTMTFEPDEFEEALVESYRKLNQDDVEKPELLILSMSATLEQCTNALDVVRDTVETLLNSYYQEALDELGIIPLSDVNVLPISSELGDPLVLCATVTAVPDFGMIKCEGLKASYCEVVTQGIEIDDRIAQACDLYHVKSVQSLIKKVGTYKDEDEMRTALGMSLRLAVEQLNSDAQRRATADALLEANSIEVTDSEIERYIDGEIEKLKNQLGEEKISQMDYENLRTMVKRDVGHLPKLNIILSSIAVEKCFLVSDEDRREVIRGLRSQSINPDDMESVEKTMSALEGNPSMRESLDFRISLDKALNYVVSKTELKPKMQIAFKEAQLQISSNIMQFNV